MTLEKIILISLFSSIVGMILLRVMRVMINFTPKIKLMIEEIKQEDFLFDKIKSQLKKIKGKLVTIFLIEYIIMLVVSYYLTVFCAVFHSNQKNVVYNSIISFVMFLVLSFLVLGFISFIQKQSLINNFAYLFYSISYYTNYFFQ